MVARCPWTASIRSASRRSTKTTCGGGERIGRAFGRRAPAGIVAESWEISDHPDGMSVVANGVRQGATLRALVEAWGPRLLGAWTRGTRFPLLVKIIDAKQRLSVQVHPSEATAGVTGGEPKTEMWYALDAAPGAGVFAGLRRPVSRADFLAAVARNAVEDMMRFLPMRKGDAVFIPGGRIHAIGEGCLLLEVQQNSNTTYRVYDWGRTGADGKPRPLHLDKAVLALDLADAANPRTRRSFLRPAGRSLRRLLAASSSFRVERWDLVEPMALPDADGTFIALFVAAGAVRLQCAGAAEELLRAGDSCLLPAALRDRRLCPDGSAAQVVAATVPQP